MTFLMGVLVNAPIPTVETAAQKPIFASMRTNSSAEKLMCIPKKSCPGYSLLASAKVGPHTCNTSRLVNTPRTGLFAHVAAGGGKSGVGRYVGKFVRGTWIVSRTPSRCTTRGSVAEIGRAHV